MQAARHGPNIGATLWSRQSSSPSPKSFPEEHLASQTQDDVNAELRLTNAAAINDHGRGGWRAAFMFLAEDTFSDS
jgi:hypothetical protein